MVVRRVRPHNPGPVAPDTDVHSRERGAGDAGGWDSAGALLAVRLGVIPGLAVRELPALTRDSRR